MAKNKRPKKQEGEPLELKDFRSLDDYFDYYGVEEDYRPIYRQDIIAWIRLSDEEKLAMQSEQ